MTNPDIEKEWKDYNNNSFMLNHSIFKDKNKLEYFSSRFTNKHLQYACEGKSIEVIDFLLSLNLYITPDCFYQSIRFDRIKIFEYLYDKTIIYNHTPKLKEYYNWIYQPNFSSVFWIKSFVYAYNDRALNILRFILTKYKMSRDMIEYYISEEKRTHKNPEMLHLLNQFLMSG